MSKTLGQVGYDRYLTSGPKPRMTFDGRPMPSWDDLDKTEAGQITKARWEAGAEEIAWAILTDGVSADVLGKIAERLPTSYSPLPEDGLRICPHGCGASFSPDFDTCSGCGKVVY